MFFTFLPTQRTFTENIRAGLLVGIYQMRLYFRLRIWCFTFPVGDFVFLLSGCGFGVSPFRLETLYFFFPVANLVFHLTSWRLCISSFRLRIWCFTFPVGDFVF